MAETEYIEREELINRLEDAKEKLMNNITMSSLMAVVVNDIYINFIKESPTADVVEVRHGHWVETAHKGYKCSLCNCLSSLFDENLKSEFCPWCGAKMDGNEVE